MASKTLDDRTVPGILFALALATLVGIAMFGPQTEPTPTLQGMPQGQQQGAPQ